MEKNIVRIEPSPFKKSPVKIQRKTISTKGSKVQYRTTAEGKQVPITNFVDEKSLLGLPGTVRVYKQALTKYGLATGLDKIVDNPYVNEVFYRDDWEKILKDKKRIRLQELLEYKHGHLPGFYTNQGLNTRSTNISHQKGEELKFFQRADSNIVLNEGVTFLDLNSPKDEVIYYSCLAHSKIANSYDDLEMNPDATHYIVKEEEKITRESQEKRKYNKAGSMLEEIFDIADDTIQNFAKALDIKRKNMTKDVAYNEIEAYYRKDEENLENFTYFYDLWNTKATRAKWRAHVDLFNYVNTPGLITVRNGRYYWNQPDLDTGKKIPWEWESKDKVIEFLMAPEYQVETDLLEQLYKQKLIELA